MIIRVHWPLLFFYCVQKPASSSNIENTGRFVESPLGFIGSINSRVEFTCVYETLLGSAFSSSVRQPVVSANLKSNIVWLKRELGNQDFNKIIIREPTREFEFFEKRISINVYSKTVEKQNTRFTQLISQLVIEKVSYGDMGGYKCLYEKENTYGGPTTNEAFIAVEPDMLVSPSAVTKIPGEKFELVCNVTYHKSMIETMDPPNALIEWKGNLTSRINPNSKIELELLQGYPVEHFHHDGGLSVIQRSTGEGKLRSTLSPYEPTSNYAGIYFCEFNYMLISERRVLRKAAIVRSGPVFSEEMVRSLKVYEGDDVKLPCAVEATPYVTIKWQRNLDSIIHNTFRHPADRRDANKFFLIESFNGNQTNVTLSLKNIQYSDKAEYTCNATSYDGSRVSWTVLLRVKHKLFKFIPFSVIVAQTFLILLLIIFAEWLYVKKDHNHDFPLYNSGSRRTLKSTSKC